MESWLDPKAFLDAVRVLENALKDGDPLLIRTSAEAVVEKRDQFFDAARGFVAGMTPKRE